MIRYDKEPIHCGLPIKPFMPRTTRGAPPNLPRFFFDTLLLPGGVDSSAGNGGEEDGHPPGDNDEHHHYHDRSMILPPAPSLPEDNALDLEPKPLASPTQLQLLTDPTDIYNLQTGFRPSDAEQEEALINLLTTRSSSRGDHDHDTSFYYSQDHNDHQRAMPKGNLSVPNSSSLSGRSMTAPRAVSTFSKSSSSPPREVPSISDRNIMHIPALSPAVWTYFENSSNVSAAGLSLDAADTSARSPPDPRLQQDVLQRNHHKKLKSRPSLSSAAAAVGRPSSSTTSSSSSITVSRSSSRQQHDSSAWMEKYQQVVAFFAEHGHSNVPSIYPTNQVLANWVKRTRHQYKVSQQHPHGPSSLSQHRIDLLDKIHLQTDLREISWQEQYQRLLYYKAQHGHARVSHKDDPVLHNWVKRQRQHARDFTKGGGHYFMTPTRYQQLMDVGIFEW